ncbi:RidA family protein [Pseudomonas putida]
MIQRFEPNGKRLSHVLVHNGIAYVTGQTPVDRSQGITGQTQQILTRIDELLAIAGTDKSKILFAQVWLKHVVQDFAAMNAVWEQWIPAEALPARATVEANLAAESILVEIALQAAI